MNHPMMLRAARLALAIVPALTMLSAHAATDQYDHRYYVSPMFNYVFSDSDRGTGNGIGGSFGIGKRVTPSIELELRGIYTKYDLNNTQQQAIAQQAAAAGRAGAPLPSSERIYAVGVGGNFFPFVRHDNLFQHLFVHLDAMWGVNHAQSGLTNNYSSGVFEGGLGYDLPLDFLIGRFVSGASLRMEALYRLDRPRHGLIGNNPKASSNLLEPVLGIGFRIPLGAAPPPPPPPPSPPPPVKVVPVEKAPAPAPPPPPPPCKAPAPGQPIDLDGCKAGDKLVLNGVTFNFNKSTLTPNAKTILNQVGDALSSNKSMKVELDGYTDSIGKAAYNTKLSQRRADSVKQYLVGRGIDAGRMTTKGFGETHPVATNKTDEGRAENRRVELAVTAN